MHRLSRDEQERRNQEIQRMIEYGCSYDTIARRYGIHPKYINNLLRRGKIEKGAKACFGNASDWGRDCLDGCS